jgi:hypothetical protein
MHEESYENGKAHLKTICRIPVVTAVISRHNESPYSTIWSPPAAGATIRFLFINFTNKIVVWKMLCAKVSHKNPKSK